MEQCLSSGGRFRFSSSFSETRHWSLVIFHWSLKEASIECRAPLITPSVRSQLGK
jgi:hypothetical protein